MRAVVKYSLQYTTVNRNLKVDQIYDISSAFTLHMMNILGKFCHTKCAHQNTKIHLPTILGKQDTSSGSF